jgi:ribonuclease Z
MKSISGLAGLLLLLTAPQAVVRAQKATATTSDSSMTVVLLGTRSGPAVDAQRLGTSTLVLAGPEKLLFDCGRASTTGMARLAINPADVTKVFLTHLHSDHIVSLPELVLFPWASQGRATPLQVWGPDGTRSMVKHLLEAFSFDIHIRRDVDEKYSPDGIRVIANDIREGVVHEANGVKVSAFFVDHGPVKPAFGYRVDYQGHSVVISGDTKPSESLVKFSQNVDVLIHELGQSKQDPRLTGPPDELIPSLRVTRRQARTIVDHHTDAAEAGQVFQRVQPKLAVFSHYPNIVPAEVLRVVTQSYAGRVEFGEDMMTIDIGNAINIRRFSAAGK